MRRHLYPANWERVSAEVRARSGGRCECTGQCGLHRGRRCVERHGQPARWARGRIVLTVMHLNHDKTDSRRKNLLAACQRCHLRYDRTLRSERRRRAEELAGQRMLFGVALSDRVLA